jgi:RNA polymerase sigma factor (sigma-70 family)
VLSDDDIRRLAHTAATRHCRRYPVAWREFDEVVSAAMFGIAQSIATADPDRDYQQRCAHAASRAAGAIIDDWRARTPGARRTGGPPTAALSLDRLRDDGYDFAAQNPSTEDRAVLDALLAGLSTREELILRATLIEGQPLRVVANALGVSVVRVLQIRRRAIEKARRQR